jgi:beta-phosphoglucomutase
MSYNGNKPIKICTTVPSFHALTNDFKNIRCVLFDLDGTIFNTELLHAQSLSKFFNEFVVTSNHFSVEELQSKFMGLTEKMLYDELIVNKIIDSSIKFDFFLDIRNKLALEKLDNFQYELIDPAMLVLLKKIKEEGYVISIVSSAEKLFVDAILNKFDISDYFDFVITRESTIKNKPDPMPYNLAIHKSTLDTSQIIVFEDSMVGMTSALKAGLRVIQANWYRRI